MRRSCETLCPAHQHETDDAAQYDDASTCCNLINKLHTATRRHGHCSGLRPKSSFVTVQHTIHVTKLNNFLLFNYFLLFCLWNACVRSFLSCEDVLSILYFIIRESWPTNDGLKIAWSVFVCLLQWWRQWKLTGWLSFIIIFKATAAAAVQSLICSFPRLLSYSNVIAFCSDPIRMECSSCRLAYFLFLYFIFLFQFFNSLLTIDYVQHKAEEEDEEAKRNYVCILIHFFYFATINGVCIYSLSSIISCHWWTWLFFYYLINSSLPCRLTDWL